MERRTIAVFFGGRSVEHDVSILTGLQFLDAMDPDRYDGLPVYIDPKGQWWTGQDLRARKAYPLTPKGDIRPVSLGVGTPVGGRPVLLGTRKGLLGEKVEQIGFDLAMPALHGTHGEDGAIQGLFDFHGLPYAGCRPLGAAAAMDKHFTKALVRDAGVTVLPHALVNRPAHGRYLTADTGLPQVDAVFGARAFPLLVKPRRLGSSVGVKKVADLDQLLAALLAVFRLDDAALVEPFVPNLMEFNVAVRRADGQAVASAIERPIRAADLLDFQGKYLAQGDRGPKREDVPSAGMAGTNREIDPADLTEAQRRQIRTDAIAAFDRLDLAGSVRVDFLCDGETGELWFNEVNTIPGSFAFYLWAAAEPPIGFTALATALIEEGFALSAARQRETGAEAGGARIFGRG